MSWSSSAVAQIVATGVRRSWPIWAMSASLDARASSSRRREAASSVRIRSKLSVQAPKALPRSISSGAARSPPATRAAKRSRRLKGTSTRALIRISSASTRSRPAARIAALVQATARRRAAAAAV